MILKFPTSSERAVFLERISKDAAAIRLRVKPAYAQPTVVSVKGEGMTDQILRQVLKRYIDSDVKVYEDVQFSIMAHSA